MTDRRTGWADYWRQAPQAAGCFPGAPEAIQLQIQAFWNDVAGSLAPEALVIDLACGDGAVLRQIVSTREDCQLIGVDYAVPSQHGGGFEIMGDVDCTSLPFASGSVDAITSQFGLEYAGVKASQEAARVLKQGRKLALLIHASSSQLVAHNATRHAALGAILASGLIGGDQNTQQIEDGFAALISANPHQSVVREIHQAVVISRAQGAVGTRRIAMIAGMARAEYTRLGDMVAAACTAAELDALLTPFRKAGLQVETGLLSSPSDGDFAWTVRGH